MTTWFWLIAAAMMCAALSLLLIPLFRPARELVETASAQASSLAVLREELAHLNEEHRQGRLDEYTYARAQEDLQRRALEDTAVSGQPGTGGVKESPMGSRLLTTALLTLAIPGLSFAIYQHTGNPDGLLASTQSAPIQTLAQESEAGGLLAMVDDLEQRLRANPDDGEGWLLLARSMAAIEVFDTAANAYAQANQLLPPDAQRLADHADALAMSQGRSALGEPTLLIERALALDPNHIKALALAGSAAAERADWNAAAKHWRHALTLLPPDAPLAASLQSQLARMSATQAPGAPTAGADQPARN